RLELHRVVVDLADPDDRGEPEADLARPVGIEVRRVLLLDRLEREDDRVGGEWAAVVERYALPEREHPPGGRVFTHPPGSGEAGYQRGQAVAPGQVPRDQGLVDLIAHESEAFEAVV